MRWLGLTLVLAAAPCGAASVVDVDEARASERLAARAREALDAILGPGRSKVLVEVRGERSELRTETEMTIPLDPLMLGGRGAPPPVMNYSGDLEADAAALRRILDLPGYTKAPAPDASQPGAGPQGGPLPGLGGPGFKGREEKDRYTQRDHERSVRDAGFEIKQIQASVVLDSALADEKAREASQILPNLLMIDGSRGDTLSIVRASFRPPWETAFSEPENMRRAVYAAAALLTAVLIVLIAGASFVRAARVFASELGRRRGGGEDELPAGEPLPELVPGAPPGLLDAEAEPGGPAAAEAPALGRRFDFLAEREPARCAHALAGETPDDAALVFGYLAEAMPDVASRAFEALPPELQAEVSSRLLKLRVADPDRLSEIEERLKRAVEHGLQGSERLGRILSRVPVDTRADLLGRLTLRDHEAAADVERHLFTIEDLETLNAVELRRLIAAVPYEDWGFALRGVPAGVADRVLAELPDGPRELVRDIIATPQPRDKVLDARSRVLDARGALAARGEIKMGTAEAGSELL